MVRTAEKIFGIVLLIFMLASAGYAQLDMSGSAATLKNFALPEFSKESGRLQFILYGATARNLGAIVFLTFPKVDVVKNDIMNIQDVVSLAAVQPYPLGWTAEQVKQFWKDKNHSQALIFADDAEYDKNLRMLCGDSPVHYRTRELSVDGVGFDVDQDRKFVHIRSKVKIVIYPETRKKSGVAPGSKKDTHDTKEEKK